MTERTSNKTGARKRSRAKLDETVANKSTHKRKRSVVRAGASSKSGRRSQKSDTQPWTAARIEQHRLKREVILRVASRLINRKGYAGMSLTDIANELHIRNASLYYYFKSKEDLVFACFERAQKIVGETLASVDQTQGSGLEAIELYVIAIRDRIRVDGELPVAANVFSLKHRHMKVIVTSELEHVASVAHLIERGIEDGSIRNCDVPLTTTMLFSALRSVPGHYLGVPPAEWPKLDEEVAISVRRFIAA